MTSRQPASNPPPAAPPGAGLTFRPKPSFGWAWMVLLGLAIGASTLPVLLAPPADEPVPLTVKLLMGGIASLGLVFYAIAAYFPTMRYVLGPDSLELHYGPLLNERIAYRDIDEIRTSDLTVSLWSSMRVPGLALWNVPYMDVGTVRMCSTRAARGVLLISARGKLFGISPAEESRFVAELRARAEATREARGGAQDAGAQDARP